VFAGWPRGSRIGAGNVVMVLSVGGGIAEKTFRRPSSRLTVAKSAGARIIGVVGRDGGCTRLVADACVVVPTVNAAAVTPNTNPR
jgi:D-sedoheptulose 7-phosphate isomerase